MGAKVQGGRGSSALLRIVLSVVVSESAHVKSLKSSRQLSFTATYCCANDILNPNRGTPYLRKGKRGE